MLMLSLRCVAIEETMIRTYSELIKLPTFEERFEYLKLDGVVGKETFGYDRYLNQDFYKSLQWRRIRNKIIVRDNGCDLGVEGFEIPSGVRIYIHHLNPVNEKDILDFTEFLWNLDGYQGVPNAETIARWG